MNNYEGPSRPPTDPPLPQTIKIIENNIIIFDDKLSCSPMFAEGTTVNFYEYDDDSIVILYSILDKFVDMGQEYKYKYKLKINNDTLDFEFPAYTVGHPRARGSITWTKDKSSPEPTCVVSSPSSLEALTEFPQRFRGIWKQDDYIVPTSQYDNPGPEIIKINKKDVISLDGRFIKCGPMFSASSINLYKYDDDNIFMEHMEHLGIKIKLKINNDKLEMRYTSETLSPSNDISEEVFIWTKDVSSLEPTCVASPLWSISATVPFVSSTAAPTQDDTSTVVVTLANNTQTINVNIGTTVQWYEGSRTRPEISLTRKDSKETETLSSGEKIFNDPGIYYYCKKDDLKKCGIINVTRNHIPIK